MTWQVICIGYWIPCSSDGVTCWWPDFGLYVGAYIAIAGFGEYLRTWGGAGVDFGTGGVFLMGRVCLVSFYPEFSQVIFCFLFVSVDVLDTEKKDILL